MPSIITYLITQVKGLFINVIKCGPFPRHIAFIMDGSRRYARSINAGTHFGHKEGYKAFENCVVLCRSIGVKEVTVFAFSIDNFKRSKAEINTLMTIFAEKLEQSFDLFIREGICFKVLGRLDLLNEDIQKKSSRLILLTRNNKNMTLNVAMAYTSREEMTHSIRTIVEGVQNNEIYEEDISEDLISECLYTNDNSDPDILIRSSGVVRLSDFMLWQISNSEVWFPETLWPNFRWWHLLGLIFKYKKIKLNEKVFAKVTKNSSSDENFRVLSFVEKLNRKRYAELEDYAAE